MFLLQLETPNRQAKKEIQQSTAVAIRVKLLATQTSRTIAQSSKMSVKCLRQKER